MKCIVIATLVLLATMSFAQVTVNPATAAGQVAYYPSTSQINGDTNLTDSSGTLLYSGNIRGAIQDKAGQVYNVKAYGAAGNGTTDDSTAIAAAITAAATNGGVVYFPPGTSGVPPYIPSAEQPN